MGIREAHDAEVARSFREAQLNRIRFQRIRDELDRYDIPEHVAQLCMACAAASELFYRQQGRRLFDMLDRLTTDLLPREGETMTEGQKAQLESRAQWHRKLADQARQSGDIDHAAMHTRLAEQLRDYARNGMPSEPKAPEQPKKPIRRSYI